ncbi:hypothetical protein BU25DRAFT_449693, partial [Macroventuria anomochaeta]
MLKAKSLHSVCASCRLNLAITRARNARLPQSTLALRPAQTNSFTQQRSLSTALLRRQQQAHDQVTSPEDPSGDPAVHKLNIEVNVRKARQQFRDALPRDHLSAEEYALYERLYGPPIFVDTAEELLATEEQAEEIISEEQPDGSTVLLRRGEDGELEEIDLYEEGEADLAEEDEESMTSEEWEEYREQKAATFHENVYEQSRVQHEEAEEWEDDEVEDEPFMRAHPLTIAGRFKPSPSTVFLPKETLVDPTAQLLTRANHKHLTESANRIFGGRGLPHSASTPPARLGKEQKPITLDPSQAEMGNIEADAYMAAVQPGTYASVMSALVEVRRRLGTPWMEHMLAKKGGTILDAGSGGVGILAWQEILKAEWESKQETHEENLEETPEETTSQAPTSSEAQPAETSQETAPKSKATVLTSSDTLRHRASRLLENTTFIPRLPEHVTPSDDANTSQPRKVYDIIIAPHTLWPLRQEYLRKDQVSKYWSLLNPKGGVLILIEKGLPRGFEVIAAAREMLLERHIASPHSTTLETPLDEQVSRPEQETRFTKKETGMIIAPCTNHSACPMYSTPGKSPGRKDFCFFTQRYIRPPYLQRILNAKDRNHEDVQFSYLAVQRGRDQRLPEHDLVGKGVQQGVESTDAAFAGHEWDSSAPDAENPDLVTPEQINPLALPRLILPALKRRGHIILDVCTPAGTLERWTVPRSFSKQAFRDAKKSRWGDLWALGAKTRIPKSVRLGRPNEEFDRKGRRIRAPKKVTIEIGVGEQDGRAVDVGEDRIIGGGKKFGDRDGRYNKDRKIRGSGGRKGRKKAVDFFAD